MGRLPNKIPACPSNRGGSSVGLGFLDCGLAPPKTQFRSPSRRGASTWLGNWKVPPRSSTLVSSANPFWPVWSSAGAGVHPRSTDSLCSTADCLPVSWPVVGVRLPPCLKLGGWKVQTIHSHLPNFYSGASQAFSGLCRAGSAQVGGLEISPRMSPFGRKTTICSDYPIAAPLF